MSRLHRLAQAGVCICFQPLLLLAPSSTYGVEKWSASFDKNLMWCSTAHPELLLCATEKGLIALEKGTGAERWRVDHLNKLPESSVDATSDVSSIMVKFPKNARIKGTELVALDPISGKDRWSSAASGITTFEHFSVLPEFSMVLLSEAEFGSKDKRLAAIGSADGKLLWNVTLDKKADHVLEEYPAFVDSDSTVLLISGGNYVGRLNARSGTILWEIKKAPPGPKRSMAETSREITLDMNADKDPEVVQKRDVGRAGGLYDPEEQVLFLTMESGLQAVSMANGQFLWESVPKLSGIVTQLLLVGDNLVARTMPEWPGPTEVFILDKSTGAIHWQYPGSSSFISNVLNAFPHLSNLVAVNDSIYLVTDRNLVCLDLASRQANDLGNLGFQGVDDEVPLFKKLGASGVEYALSLEIVDTLLVASGLQNFAWVSGQGSRLRTDFYPPADKTWEGLTDLATAYLVNKASDATVNKATLKTGDVTMGFHVHMGYEKGLSKLFEERYATDASLGYFYVMTYSPADEGPGLFLVRIDKTTGVPMGRLALSTDEPRYVLDFESGEVYFLRGKKQVQCQGFDGM